MDEEEFLQVLDFDPSIMPKASAKDLPENVKWLYYAEIHRLKTGEVLTAQEYKQKYGSD